MRCEVPPPPVEQTEEYQNSLELEDDDIEIIDDEELHEFEEDHEVPIPVEDDSRLTFKEHNGGVICCKMDNKRSVAVSGGEDHKCFVWNMSTGEKIDCIELLNLVAFAEFSHDSSLLAISDTTTVLVWDMEKREKTPFNFTTSEVEWFQWVPGKDCLIVGTDSDTWYWNFRTDSFQIFPTDANPISRGKVIGKRLIAGYGDGSIRVWDLKHKAALKVVAEYECHDCPIAAMECDNKWILSGSIDGTISLISASGIKVIDKLECVESLDNAGKPDSVQSLALIPSYQTFVAGTIRGSIAIWDMTSFARKLHIKQEGSVMKIMCSRETPLFFTSGEDGVVRLYDCRTGGVESSYKGHEGEILDFDLSNDGQSILTASEDGTCKVFCVGHT